MFFITLARLGLTGARAQVPVGWKEICAVVERSLLIRTYLKIKILVQDQGGAEF